MTLLWRLTMMIMMLVIKSSGTCSWTQVSSSAESIRWKSCESSSVICSATWQVNFLLLGTWTVLLELHILWVAVLIYGLCDTTSTDLKLSKLWHRGFRLKLPDLWKWNQFGQWKRCWQLHTSLFVLKNELGPDRMLFLPLAKFSIVDKTNLKARANPKFPCLIKLVMNSVNFSRRLLFKKSTCLVKYPWNSCFLVFVK